MNLLADISIIVLTLGWFFWWLWRRSKAHEATRWPSAEGTVESGAMEVVASVRGSKVELPVFAFSYKVGEQYFGGRFALLPYITDPGSSIVERMVGRKLQVRYDPKQEEDWFIPDELIEGCKVEQQFSADLLNLKPND